MVVDQRTLKANMLRSSIGSNVRNKLTGQQAQTQQTTPTVQQTTDTPITQSRGLQQTTQQQPEVYKVITNKFPTYDVKDLMGFGPQATKNAIGFMQSVGNYNRLQQQAEANTDPNVRYNLTKPELTNKQTLQIQQATPETNEQGLKINKTNSFKDLVIDLQNVANQGRNLEFMKFRELYPEYVENWDRVVDLFESIKSNPQYSAEKVTETAQKAYPELFGIKDNLSDKDKTTALKKLYDEMVSNKQNGIQLTQQDIIDRYPEYANTEDINTVMEVQNLMNRDRKNTPTFNDIYENFESLTKGDVEVGNTEKSTMKKDIDKINNMSQSTYDHLSEEGKKYVQYLATAKEIADYVKEQYYTKASDIEIVENLKNNNPDLYNEIFGDMDIQANLSEEDRKLLDEGYTIGAGKSWWEQVKHSATEKLAGLGRQMQNRAGTEWKGEWNPQPVNGQREDGTYYRNPLMRDDGTLETNPVKIREIKMAGNNYQQRVRTQEYRGKNPGMDKIDYKIGEFLFGLGEEIQRVGEKATAKIESSQNWKDIMELNKTSFWDALKKGDVKTMLSKSTAALGQSTIDMGLGALTGDPLVAFGSMYAGSYERAMQDIESDENLKGMTREEKERAARLMAGVESVIEEASMSVMMPGVFGGEGALSKLLPGFNNALLKGIVQTELGAASEGGEEVLQEFFNNLITQSYGSDRELGDLQDYWNIFSETFLSSQLMSVIGGTKEGVQQAQINQIQNEIKKQGELRNTVLEGQALISEDFNDFAQRVEEVPGTTTEELQQVWNNAQQKKQDLEQKANNITSNSYNNVNVPTYERTTVKDTVKPKITANESQQYTDLLDEMIKNKEISEEDRKRVEKTLGVFTLNTKEEQDNKIGQQEQPSGLANINQNSDTNNGEKSNIISRSQRQLVQNYNRMNPKAIDDFKDQFKQDYGQFLVDRGFTKAGEDNLNDLVQYADTLLKLKDKALEPMQGRYQDRSLEDMLEMVVDRARNTKNYKKIEEYEKLLQKYNEGGIEVSEILSMMRWFNYKIKTGFFKEQNSEKLDLATNVYMATRDFLDKTAKENGLDSLDKLNREIRAVEHIIGGITYKLQGSSANNMLGLNDYISLGAVIANPDAFAFAVTKLALKNPNVRNLVLRLAVGKRGNSKNRITESKLNDELNRINAIADQKARDAAVKDFNEKYGIDKKALPYKEGYNGTPTTTITVTPEGLSKTQGKVNTPNNEQKSQGLSETEKKSEPQDNVNEQVQDSIEDFLSDVGANETKQDLENATTANYKNMSKRGLEQLLNSDKIPAEEVKKITDELAMRNVKEDKDGWDYLDHKYAYEIQQLQEEEQRIGKVGNKKVNKTYAEEQMKTWETKKEKLKEDMKQAYGDKDNDRVEDKYSELEGKPIDYINEWKKSKRFAVDEAEQQVIAKLQENWNKIKRFELNMTEEEKKVREDILGKVSDLYETKSTDYGDSFVSRTNRDNRGIIYRDDGRVNVNSLDTLKSSGLYDVLPDDTKITISGQEQTTLGELKKQPKGLAEVSNTQAEQEVEGLAKINEKIAQEEQEKLDKENAEKQRLKDNVTRESIRDMDTKDAELDSERSIAEGQRAMLSEQEKAQQYFDSQEGLANITKKNTGNEYENLLNKYRAKIVDRLGLPKGTYLNKEIYDNLTPEQHKIVDEITEEYKAEYSKLQEESNRIREQEEARIESARQARNNEIANRAMRERQRLDMNGIKPAKSLPKGHKWTDEGSFTITTPGGTKLTILPIGNDLYIRNWSQIGTRGVNNTVIENYKRFAATELTNILNDDSVMGQEYGDFGGIITEIWSKLGLPLGFTQSILRPLNGPRFQKGRGNAITKKQVTQLVKQLKKTGLAKDVKIYNTQQEFLDEIYGSENQAKFQLADETVYTVQPLERIEEMEQTILDEYGTTENPYRVAFIDNKGRWINGNMGGYGNYRDVDHREIAQTAFDDTDIEFETGTDGLVALQAQTGLVRVNYNDGYLNIDTVYGLMPSQREGLMRFAQEEINQVYVDITDPKTGRSIESKTFDSVRDAVMYIDNHFSNIQYLKDTHGDIAGAVTPDGTVHLIESNLRGDTATHEFSHLLWSYAKKNNPNLYKALQKIAREAPQELKDYVKRTYGEMTDEAFLDEVFAWKQGKYSGIKTARTWYQRMWDAIKNIWNSIKNSFGSKYADLDVFEAYETMSSEELMDRVDKLLKGGKEIGKGNGNANYEISNNAVDSQGKKLTPEQQMYFADSKVRDKNGNLLRVYHGTMAGDFTVYERGKTNVSNNLAKVGYWFSPDQKGAKAFAENSYRGGSVARTEEVYLDIKNPKIYEPSEINLLDDATREDKINEQWNIYRKKQTIADGKDYTKAGGFFHDEYEHSYYERMIFQDLKRSYENDKQYEGKFGKYDPEGFRALAEEWNREYEAKLDYDKILSDFEDYEKSKEEAQIEHEKYQDMAYSDPYEDFQFDIYKVDSNMDRRWTKGDLNMALNDYDSPIKYVEKLKAEGYDGIIIRGTEYDGDVFGGRNDQYVVFDSNQIKRITNDNPTSNPDVRYEKIGGLNNMQIRKFAVQQGLAEISKPQTKEYTVDKGKVKENF